MKSYLEIRGDVYKNGHRLTKLEIAKYIKTLESLHERSLSNTEKEGISDLVLDLEVLADKVISIKSSKEDTAKKIKFRYEDKEVRVLCSSPDIMLTIIDKDSVGLLREVERELYRECLSICNGNRTKAAKMIGVSTRTLRNKINEFQQRGEIEKIDLSGLRKKSESAS